MTQKELLQMQAEMRVRSAKRYGRRHIPRNKRLPLPVEVSLPKPQTARRNRRPKADIQAERELRAARKKARALRRKKKYLHKRWLQLKRDCKGIKSTAYREWLSLCADERELQQEMRAVTKALEFFRKPLNTQRSLGIAEGYRLAKEIGDSHGE